MIQNSQPLCGLILPYMTLPPLWRMCGKLTPLMHRDMNQPLLTTVSRFLTWCSLASLSYAPIWGCLMKILCEFTRDGEHWDAVGPALGPDDMLGSFSDLTSGRDVYMFGFRDGIPGLWRSMGGTDEEFGELRKTSTLGLEPISTLMTPHEMVIVHPTQGMLRIRLSRVED